MLTTEQLAETLHKFYRAASKTLHGGLSMAHDHGWNHCNKKKYFLRRAELIQKELRIGIIKYDEPKVKTDPC